MKRIIATFLAIAALACSFLLGGCSGDGESKQTREPQSQEQLLYNGFDDPVHNKAVSEVLGALVPNWDLQEYSKVYEIVEGTTYEDFFSDRFFKSYRWSINELSTGDLMVVFDGYPYYPYFNSVEVLFLFSSRSQTCRLNGFYIVTDDYVASYTVNAEDVRGVDRLKSHPAEDRYSEVRRAFVSIVVRNVAPELTAARSGN